MERLLEESGVSRSTFYVHFADKSALLLALAEETVDQVQSSIAQGVGRWSRPGVADVSNEVRALISVYRRHAPVLRAVREVGSYDDEIQEYWRRHRDEAALVVAGFLRDEQTRGVVAGSVDVDTASMLIAQLTDNAIHDHLVSGDPDKDGVIAGEIARIGWLAFYGATPEE